MALKATLWRSDRGLGGPEIIIEKGKFYRHRNLRVKRNPQGFLEGKIRLDSESDKLFQVALGHRDERFTAFKEWGLTYYLSFSTKFLNVVGETLAKVRTMKLSAPQVVSSRCVRAKSQV